jgi:hypothetical protein
MNWISFDDKPFPQDGKEFLVVYPYQGNVMQLVRFDVLHNRWLTKGKPTSVAGVFHWMPLPDPPEAK